MTTIMTIEETVCTAYGVTLPELKGGCRDRDLVIARWVYMFLLQKYIELPYKAIAFLVGCKRSAVSQGIRTLIELCCFDNALLKQVVAVEDMCNGWVAVEQLQKPKVKVWRAIRKRKIHSDKSE